MTDAHVPFARFPNKLTCAKRGRDGDSGGVGLFFPIYAILLCFSLHMHTREGAHLDVEAKRLTLKVGLLIRRISARSKRTIKDGCLW